MESVRIQILQMNGIKLNCLGGKRFFFNPNGHPMNQYVDRGFEKDDGYFTMEFNSFSISFNYTRIVITKY